MKKVIISIGIMLILCSTTGFALLEELSIRHPVPAGWKFKDLEVGEKYIGIRFLPDGGAGENEGQEFPEALVHVLDKKTGTVVSELKAGISERFKLLKGNKILLIDGDESGDNAVRLLGLNGQERWRIRWPQGLSVKGLVIPDLRGKEFAYADLVWGSFSTPAVVYEFESGKEKFSYGPPNLPQKLREVGIGLKVFLPVGEGEMFLLGLGASLFLKHYDGRKDAWAISDIGGNISNGKFLNDECVVVNYWRDEAKSHLSGLAVLDWKTGKIIFRLENKRVAGKPDKKWSIPYVDFIFLDEDDNSLIFSPDKDSDLVIRVPYNPAKKTWEERGIRRYRAALKGKMVGNVMEYQKLFQGKYVVDEEEEAGRRILKIKKAVLKEEN